MVPGGGISTDSKRWVSCRKGFFLPVRVLSRLSRRLFLEQLRKAHREDKLSFYAAATLDDAHRQLIIDWLSNPIFP